MVLNSGQVYPVGDIADVWKYFLTITILGGRSVLQASIRQKSGVLLNISQGTEQPFTTNNYPGQNIKSAKVEKSSALT